MKGKLICILMVVMMLAFCGCADSTDDQNTLSSANVTSFATAEEEREYWLNKEDYLPECDSSGDPIETFNAVIDNNTYLGEFNVVIRHDVSLKGYEFTKEDFKGVDNILYVGISGKVMSEEKYKEHNDGNYEKYYNNYHQEITIIPKERTIEKVSQMYLQLKKLPFVHDVWLYEKGTGIDCEG